MELFFCDYQRGDTCLRARKDHKDVQDYRGLAERFALLPKERCIWPLSQKDKISGSQVQDHGSDNNVGQYNQEQESKYSQSKEVKSSVLAVLSQTSR